MARATITELTALVEQLRAKMAAISGRLEALEGRKSGKDAVPMQTIAPPIATEPAPTAITEEELLAISAAIAAYLGVRAHIRQIRLVSSGAWSQQGRVSIQASHRLQA
jgi:methylmalonyl-CoA carboxyltransferase 12S subunit